MLGISYSNLAIGVCSYAIAVKEGVFFTSTLPNAIKNRELKGVGEVAWGCIGLVAASSWAVLWTHSVGLICIGSQSRWVEKTCFGAFAFLYHKEVCLCEDILQESLDSNPSQVSAYLWKLIGNVSFLAWSIFSLIRASFDLSPSPMIPLLLLVGGVIAFTMSYLNEKSTQNNPENQRKGLLG